MATFVKCMRQYLVLGKCSLCLSSSAFCHHGHAVVFSLRTRRLCPFVSPRGPLWAAPPLTGVHTLCLPSANPLTLSSPSSLLGTVKFCKLVRMQSWVVGAKAGCFQPKVRLISGKGNQFRRV